MNETKSPTEDQLIENCIRGERISQRILYECYFPKMFTICIRYIKNEADTEDVLQEGFVKLFNNLHVFRKEGSFEGWARRIFVNTAIEILRRQNLPTVTAEGLENAVVDNRQNALGSLYEKDIIQRSQMLSDGYKVIFHLYAIEGYSHKEIAYRLGISESTSKSQFFRARALLRNIIENEDLRYTSGKN